MNNKIFLVPIMIGFAGLLGTLCRYGLSLAYQKYSLTLILPIGTFLANIGGCFIIGIISAIAERGEILSPEMRIVLATGFCGGFTTMSSTIYETIQLLRDNEIFYASMYLSLTIFLSLIAFILGFTMIKLILK